MLKVKKLDKKTKISTDTDYIPNGGDISKNTHFLDNYNVHKIIKEESLEKLQIISKKLALPVHLMLMNLDGNANIAMSIRTATVLGCSKVWIVGKMKYDQRAAVGAKNFINIEKLDSLKNPKEFFKEKNIEPFIVEQGGQALEEFNFKPYILTHKSVCFILGSEKEGFSKELLDAMSDAPKLTISQYGVMKCLNVSISASIVMYEFMKQWRNCNVKCLS